MNQAASGQQKVSVPLSPSLELNALGLLQGKFATHISDQG